ncbi:MAG: hypothetical protein IJC90_01470 [Clostridia bacterium]|nr:hypothetical protein [Clostridia bacterium]
MKKDKSKKFAVLAGLFFFIPALTALPSIISMNIITGSDLTSQVMLRGLIVLAVDSLISLALSIALFVRKKNASFVVITSLWLVFYIARCIVLVSGFSINIFLNVISLVVIVWLFMTNCLPKFKGYISTTKGLWFVPYVLNVLMSFFDLIENVTDYLKFGLTNEIVMTVITIGFGGAISSLSYLFMGLWLYKSYENEINNNDLVLEQPTYITAPELVEVKEETTE